MKRVRIRKPFYGLASWFYRKMYAGRFSLLQTSQTDLDLRKLSPGADWEEERKEYYVNKLAMSFMILFAGTIFAAAVAVKVRLGTSLQQGGAIVRGEEPKTLEVSACFGENTSLRRRKFQIEILPRQKTLEEIQPVYDKFSEEFPRLILGENETLEQVCRDLCLLEMYEGYPFAVEWHSDKPYIISETGTVCDRGRQEEVELTAVITYGDNRWEKVVSIRIVPEAGSWEEEMYRELEAFLIASEEAERLKQEWKLPEVWQGQAVEWVEVGGKEGLLLWITSVICAVAVYFLSDRDLHEKLEKRREQMKREYPGIVHKLVLYLGAGLTVRGAFGKVAGEHIDEADRGRFPAYEEMQYTFREIQAGVSEGRAYEHFGKRSGLQEYIRLAMLLSQNLRKGDTAFLNRLRKEAERAYIEQIQNGRRLAEEAATKLLLPMGMLLMVVMVIVMIPAFSSMGM